MFRRFLKFKHEIKKTEIKKNEDVDTALLKSFTYEFWKKKRLISLLLCLIVLETSSIEKNGFTESRRMVSQNREEWFLQNREEWFNFGT